MKLQLKADDKMPWGVYKEMTVREIYKNAPAYFKNNILGSCMLYLSDETKKILRLDLDQREVSAFNYSAVTQRSSTNELTTVTKLKNGPYKGKTLYEIVLVNESYVRYLITYGSYFISEQTYNDVKKYKSASDKNKEFTSPDPDIEPPVKNNGRKPENKLTKNEIDKLIDDKIIEYSNGIDPEKDLDNYIGGRVDTNFSSKAKSAIKKLRVSKKFDVLADLKAAYGKDATFREGQEEAILSVLYGNRTLVVQRTSWGKSCVYFISIKQLRAMGLGPAIIISPLIALMRDQVSKCSQFGLTGVEITSENQKEWTSIYKKIKNNKVDVAFVAPEKLDNFTFMQNIKQIVGNISLFVIDEAHCISDWGHDFRPDFRRIAKFVKELPSSTRILATTATANNRVVRDIEKQLGSLEKATGCLLRENFYIDVLNLHTESAKNDWLQRNIPLLQKNGPGLIYCQKRDETEKVARFLRNIGINAKYYHARLGLDEKKRNIRQIVEEEFKHNQISVLVTTIAFGMGVDIDNIAYVIHYSQVKSIIEFYQQIGRGGRDIAEVPKMYAITLCGDNDNNFNVYTITHAFPNEKLQRESIDYITNNPECSRDEYKEHFGITDNESAEKTLKYLRAEGYIYRKNSRYFIGDREWTGDMKREKIVSYYRWKEFREFNQFLASNTCYMKQIREKLDEPHNRAIPNCGKCSICQGKHFFE